MALWTSRTTHLKAHIVIPVVAIAVAVAQISSNVTALATASGVLSGLLVIATIIVIAHGVIRAGVVDAQSVFGAITVYILLGCSSSSSTPWWR